MPADDWVDGMSGALYPHEKEALAKEARLNLLYAKDDLRKLRKENALLKRIISRLPLCPDHRDKVRDICCWCEVERLRKELANGN